jgi:hypothetical protein
MSKALKIKQLFAWAVLFFVDDDQNMPGNFVDALYRRHAVWLSYK